MIDILADGDILKWDIVSEITYVLAMNKLALEKYKADIEEERMKKLNKNFYIYFI